MTALPATLARAVDATREAEQAMRAAEIAAKLTPAQKRALLSVGAPGTHEINITLLEYVAMAALFVDDRAQLRTSPLGASVRAILASETSP